MSSRRSSHFFFRRKLSQLLGHDNITTSIVMSISLLLLLKIAKQAGLLCYRRRSVYLCVCLSVYLSVCLSVRETKTTDEKSMLTRWWNLWRGEQWEWLDVSDVSLWPLNLTENNAYCLKTTEPILMQCYTVIYLSWFCESYKNGRRLHGFDLWSGELNLMPTRSRWRR